MSLYFACAYTCPKCGGAVSETPDCPGYGHDETLPDGTIRRKVMVCYPFCGNATYFSCDDRAGCGWWWREENRRSTTEWNSYSRTEVEMGPRPDWLDAWVKEREACDDELDDTYY